MCSGREACYATSFKTVHTYFSTKLSITSYVTLCKTKPKEVMGKEGSPI